MQQVETEGYLSAHHWVNRFSALSVKLDAVKDHETSLIKWQVNQPLDQWEKICVCDALFVVLHDEHKTDHLKGDNLYKSIKEKWDNIPRECCKLFSKTCPISLEKG